VTRNEFIDLIDRSGDIMFSCAGKNYTILFWNEEGPLISEQNTEYNERVFPNGKTLVSQYIIDGKPLKDRIEEIKITYSN